MIKLYLAAPLFNQMERERNVFFAKKLGHTGFDVFLPQRDAGEIAKDADPKECFNRDIEAIKDCDWLLALCDGRTQDEGMCVEIGYAYAKGKHICVIYDDVRRYTETQMMNNMILGAAHAVCQTIDDAIGVMKSWDRMPE